MQGGIFLVLIDIYGKIEPRIISSKLGVGICNLSFDWITGLQADLYEEVLIYNHFLEFCTNQDDDNDLKYKKYDLDQIVESMEWQEEGKSSMQIIAEHLIEIQVIDFDKSMLQLKNRHMDSPTCEPQYTRKFIEFCSNVQSSNKAQKVIPSKIPFSIYNSDDLNAKPLILQFVKLKSLSNLSSDISVKEYTDASISSLEYIGNLIDRFISSDEDFWLLDYIISSMFSDKELNAYHIFKVMTLIEMLIVNPRSNGITQGEIEKKLPQFLSDRIEVSKRTLFSELMRKLRNKIGHGDFKAVNKLLENYRQIFMNEFWFDEYEYSIENWTYINICIQLDYALNEILWLMLSDKPKLLSIQKG